MFLALDSSFHIRHTTVAHFRGTKFLLNSLWKEWPCRKCLSINLKNVRATLFRTFELYEGINQIMFRCQFFLFSFPRSASGMNWRLEQVFSYGWIEIDYIEHQEGVIALAFNTIKPFDDCLAVSPLISFCDWSYFIIDVVQYSFACDSYFVFGGVDESAFWIVFKMFFVIFQRYKCFSCRHGFNLIIDVIKVLGPRKFDTFKLQDIYIYIYTLVYKNSAF